jgi:hypothetical protein
VRVGLRRSQSLDNRASKGGMIEWWIIRDLEGSGRNLIEVISWNMTGRAEEKQENNGMLGAPTENGTEHLANVNLDSHP